MIVNPIKSGKNTKDATIEAVNVDYGKVAYGKDGKIVGTNPIIHMNGDPEYGIIPISGQWRCGCYGNDMYIALDYKSNTVAYSKDGMVWNCSALPSGMSSSVAVCYGNGTFVALRYCSSTAIYSIDGINWEKIVLPVSANWQSVAYGNGKFVAISYDSDICIYSEDGINWIQTIMPTLGDWTSVCYGNDKFVAVGNKVAAYSYDGIIWVQSTLPSSKVWKAITYGNGVFIAVNYTGVVALYSTNGIDWIEVNIPQNNHNNICYGNGIFLAVGHSSKITYSTNGIDWEQADLPLSANYRVAIYGDRRFVTLAHSTNFALSSEDCINWSVANYTGEIISNLPGGISLSYGDLEPRKMIISDTELKFEGDYTTGDSTVISREIMTSKVGYGTDGRIVGRAPLSLVEAGSYDLDSATQRLCYGNGVYVSCVERGNIAQYSYDGITWNGSGFPASASWSCICYGNGKFVAISSDNYSGYSYNGISWTKTTMPSGSWYSVTYGNGKFVAVAHGSDITAYSTDGINWTQSTMPFSASWHSITYGNDMFVAVARRSDKAAYSIDGINWTQTIMPTQASWVHVCYGNGKFVAISNYDSDVAAYSTDGINWVQTTMPTLGDWTSVCYGNGTFVAIGYNSNEIAYSTDGDLWTSVDIGLSLELGDLIYDGKKFMTIYNYYTVSSYDGQHWFIGSQSTYQLEDVAFGMNIKAPNGVSRHLVVKDNRVIFEGEDTQEATIEPKNLMFKEIGYGANGKVIGAAPLTLIENGEDNGLLPYEENWTSVCYGNDKFVAIGSYSSRVAYSSNGIDWIAATISYSNWKSVCYGNGKFVAISGGGASSDRSAYSEDGITWSTSTLPVVTHWDDICYGNGVFVTTAWRNVAYSLDGVNWTAGATLNHYYDRVRYGNGVFVMVGNGSRNAAYSTDGINWVEIELPDLTHWYNITYGNGHFVTFGYPYGAIAYSTDGINWSCADVETLKLYQVTDVCYGDKGFVAINDNSDIVLHSVDGLTWIETRRPAKIKANSVCYGNGIYVLVGYESNHVTYSIDGVNWFCGSADTYQLENTVTGMNITAEGCEARHIVVEDSKVKFEDESIIITSTTEVTEGSVSNYPENSLYVVYKEE